MLIFEASTGLGFFAGFVSGQSDSGKVGPGGNNV
jgi:hypothetical protein